MNCKKNAKSRSDDEHRLFNPAVEKVVEIGLEHLGHILWFGTDSRSLSRVSVCATG